MNTVQKTFIEAMFIFAAALFTFGFWILRRERAARKWPQAAGVIVKSTTEGGPKETRPVIEFKYQGQSYKTSHWRFGNYTMGDRMSAKAVTSRYWAGQPVTVFVNTRWVPFVIGFGFFLMAIAILAMLLLNQRSPVG
jgi:Flp pilus assembly protein TadB